MADMIKSGDVRVNWRPVSKTSMELKEGDVVSCTGRGRLEIKSVTRTKKEKFAVAMVRNV
jgi:RNA-binding protein YlmH